jgi:hypothetical protein
MVRTVFAREAIQQTSVRVRHAMRLLPIIRRAHSHTRTLTCQSPWICKRGGHKTDAAPVTDVRVVDARLTEVVGIELEQRPQHTCGSSDGGDLLIHWECMAWPKHKWGHVCQTLLGACMA